MCSMQTVTYEGTILVAVKDMVGSSYIMDFRPGEILHGSGKDWTYLQCPTPDWTNFDLEQLPVYPTDSWRIVPNYSEMPARQPCGECTRYVPPNVSDYLCSLCRGID